MKKMIVLVLFVSTIAVNFTGATAQEGGLVPAPSYPYDIMTENYVPSLYFPAASIQSMRLIAVSDFPDDTCMLTYTPSLYYEPGAIAAVREVR